MLTISVLLWIIRNQFMLRVAKCSIVLHTLHPLPKRYTGTLSVFPTSQKLLRFADFGWNLSGENASEELCLNDAYMVTLLLPKL